MTPITDEFMMQMLDISKNYCVVILKTGPKMKDPGAEKIIWEHGRRNFALCEDGILAAICAIDDGSNIHGIAVFDAEEKEVNKIMDEDPGVKAGIFVFETHVCRGFLADNMP